MARGSEPGERSTAERWSRPDGEAGWVQHPERGVLALRLPETGQFILPGGGIEPGETVAAALRREIAEETGVHVNPGEPIVRDHTLFYDLPTGQAWDADVTLLQCEPIDVGSLPTHAPESDPVWLAPADLNESDFHGPSARFVATRRLTDPDPADRGELP